MHRIVQFCDVPKKYPQNLHTPPQKKKKKISFLENPKNIEIQNFEPPGENRQTDLR